MRGPLVICSVAIAGLLVPSPGLAAKAPRSTITTLAPHAEVQLKGDNGYSISVEGTGRTVTLIAERGPALASYTTRGRATPNRLEARFGSFGRVSLRFLPSGRVGRKGPPRRCEGSPAIVRTGVFVGTVEFEGEDGYVTVRAHRAKGRSSTQPRWRCNHGRRGAKASPSRIGYDVAGLKASTPKGRVLFEAAVLDERGGPAISFFAVLAKERRGSVRIERFIFTASDGPRAFLFDRGGRSATVRPPRPFHGSASFERVHGQPPTWAGSLSVSLPGALVELTGPAFEAKMPPPQTLGDEFALSG